MTTFWDIRKTQLDIWCKNTGRNEENPADFSCSYECAWQSRADELWYSHIHSFCVIWNWASHVSDWLIDERFDDHDFSNPIFKDDERIVRHFQLIHYIVYELLVDLIKYSNRTKKIKEFMEFVNNHIKHKVWKEKEITKISCKNHPLIYIWIQPSPGISEDMDKENCSSVCYFSLENLVTLVLDTYENIHSQIMKDSNNFLKNQVQKIHKFPQVHP